jgi:uncharacterized membrane protein
MTDWFNKLPKKIRAAILIAALLAIAFFWYMTWRTAVTPPPATINDHEHI